VGLKLKRISHYYPLEMNKLTKFLAVSLLSFTAIASGQQTTNQKGEGSATAQDVKTIPLQTNQSKSGITPNSSYVPGAGYVTSTWALLVPLHSDFDGNGQDLGRSMWHDCWQAEA
jgi:hypothetical protein